MKSLIVSPLGHDRCGVSHKARKLYVPSPVAGGERHANTIYLWTGSLLSAAALIVNGTAPAAELYNLFSHFEPVLSQ